MLTLKTQIFPSREGFELVYSMDSLNIYSVPFSELKTCDRSEAYQKRFKEINSQKLENFDGSSYHYEIWDGSICLGGFRLSPIGSGFSEVEEIFSTFHFRPHSFELGRLWMKYQNKGHGKKCMRVIADWLSQENVIIYFKQSSLLGNVSKEIGAISEGVYSWNHRLQYLVELLRFGGVCEG